MGRRSKPPAPFKCLQKALTTGYTGVHGDPGDLIRTSLVGVLRFRLLQCDVMFGLALGCRIERRDTLELILRSVKFKWRSRHSPGKLGKLHLAIRVGSGFEIEPPHSTKTIRDMNLDRGRVSGFAVCAHNCKFEGTGTSTASYDRNFFVMRLRFREQRDCDDDGAQNTKQFVHILTIIRAQPRQITCNAEVHRRSRSSWVSQ